MEQPICPRCKGTVLIKSGIVKGKQRYRCKSCNYFFSVLKEGKSIDPYYVIKALQLYLEGVTYREIERLLGVSHVSVMNWVKKYNVQAPEQFDYKPTYQVLTHTELVDMMKDAAGLKRSGMVITELGDKYMMIKWERFKK